MLLPPKIEYFHHCLPLRKRNSHFLQGMRDKRNCVVTTTTVTSPAWELCHVRLTDHSRVPLPPVASSSTTVNTTYLVDTTTIDTTTTTEELTNMSNFQRGDAVVVTGTEEQGIYVRCQSRIVVVIHYANDLEGVESRIHVSQLSRAPLPVIDDPNAPPIEMVTVPRARLEELLEDLSVLKGNVEELEETLQSLLN